MARRSEGGLVLAIDQGTSSTKTITTDAAGEIVSSASVPLTQSHPRSGWVEQDASELLNSVIMAVREATDVVADQIVSVGLSSQRESAVIWDLDTGAPLGPVLGWQDRRTNGAARALRANGHDAMVRESTGLPIDPMFSALKFSWLLDSVDPDRTRANAGRLALGTVDSWLMYCFTKEHRIEVGNASRTQLLNLDSAQWDDRLLELFGIPRACLPEVVSSVEPSAPVVSELGLRAGVRVSAVLGDSHAALYGHGVRTPGAVKVTYGTGSSVMGLLPEGVSNPEGLVRTIAWSTGTPVPAFEGNILSAGATATWLADLFGLSASSLAVLAEAADDSGGVYFVPAFAGLGSPWWDDEAQAAIVGLDLSSSRADVARAAFESIPLQVEDILAAADAASSARIEIILADGGPSSNSWLMQLQADLSQRAVAPSQVAELSAVGAARLAGLAAGAWSDDDNLALCESRAPYLPRTAREHATARRTAWLAAVSQARHSSARSLRQSARTVSI
jgi:glycerol kinase